MSTVHKSPLPFVKLYFGRMSTSSLWEEPPETRLLFIWFIGVADGDGYVLPHTVTNLARLANLPLDKTKAALETLESPDEGSRTKAYDGRRLLKREDGGWTVVNAGLYREMRTAKQVADAARQAEHRAKSRKRRKSRAKRDVAEQPDDRATVAFDNVSGANPNGYAASRTR
jgi:hypothetical protein